MLKMDGTEKWSSLEEIAEHLGVSKDTVYRWIADKQMPAHKVGKLWKFKISEIDQWIIKGDAADKARDNFTHLVKYHELLPGLLA